MHRQLRANALQRVSQPDQQASQLHQLAQGQCADDDANETDGLEGRDGADHQPRSFEWRQHHKGECDATCEYRRAGMHFEAQQHEDAGYGDEKRNGWTHAQPQALRRAT